MNLTQFIDRVIDDGIAAVKVDYADNAIKMRGAIAGFEACRGKESHELLALLTSAGKRLTEAFDAPDYWEWVCYHAEIEWVCNCVSAILAHEGRAVIIPPTSRGTLKAAEIVGVSP